jgi:hypothetical protein
MDSLEFMKATRGPERNKLPIHVVLQKPIPKTVVWNFKNGIMYENERVWI